MTPPPAGQATEEAGRAPAPWRTPLLLKSAHQQLTERINRSLRPHGLGCGDGLTLLALRDCARHAANPSALAEAISEAKTNTTRICDRLARRGLVTRIASSVDRRRVNVTLTDAGEVLAGWLATQAAAPPIGEILACEERASLERMLARLGHALEAGRRPT